MNLICGGGGHVLYEKFSVVEQVNQLCLYVSVKLYDSLHHNDFEQCPLREECLIPTPFRDLFPLHFSGDWFSLNSGMNLRS